jgi:hypothetical protein
MPLDPMPLTARELTAGAIRAYQTATENQLFGMGVETVTVTVPWESRTDTRIAADAQPLAAAGLAGRASLVAGIRELLRENRIAAARRMLDALPSSGFDDPAIQRLRRVLAAPVVHELQRTDVDRTAEYRWLRQHGQEYRGQWVAVDETGLVASAPTFRELQAQLGQLHLMRSPVIHRP